MSPIFSRACTHVQSVAHQLGVSLAVGLLAVACGGDAHKEPTQAENDFVGLWEEQHPAVGYESFMVIEADGQGFWCNADGKSQAMFDVTFDGEQAVLGDYEFGGGDVLTLNDDASQLTLQGEDHDEEYTVEYASAKSLPDWCQKQIDEMRE
jgi:hypothetical protein